MIETIAAKSILQADGNFNLYRGCTHGCIYCDSRSACYQIDDFEIVKVKDDAAKMLESELGRKRQKQMLRTGGMSDPYVHAEKSLGVMRAVLHAVHRHGFGVSVLSKSTLIERDLDLYQKIDARYRAIVQMTITTTSDALAKKIEPAVSLPSARLRTLKKFSDAGLITGIWMTPILPFITDTEENIRAIVHAAKSAGVTFIRHFGLGTTMREGSREHFYAQLEREFPGLKQKYQTTYGTQYVCLVPDHDRLVTVFEACCARAGILYKPSDIAALFEKDTQQKLF